MLCGNDRTDSQTPRFLLSPATSWRLDDEVEVGSDDESSSAASSSIRVVFLEELSHSRGSFRFLTPSDSAELWSGELSSLLESIMFGRWCRNAMNNNNNNNNNNDDAIRLIETELDGFTNQHHTQQQIPIAPRILYNTNNKSTR
jgi:hypothetical protein